MGKVSRKVAGKELFHSLPWRKQAMSQISFVLSLIDNKLCLQNTTRGNGDGESMFL